MGSRGLNIYQSAVRTRHDARPNGTYYGTGRVNGDRSGDMRSGGDFGLAPSPINRKPGLAMMRLERILSTRPAHWVEAELYVSPTKRAAIEAAEREATKLREGKRLAAAAARDAKLAAAEAARLAKAAEAERARIAEDEDMARHKAAVLAWEGHGLE
jgi:hypothetical protein